MESSQLRIQDSPKRSLEMDRTEGIERRALAECQLIEMPGREEVEENGAICDIS